MDETKLLIIGGNGQLGLALQKKYPLAKSADISELDITNEESVRSFEWSGVEVILNAAAFTNVDGAETPEGRFAAWNVNAKAVSYLSSVANENKITLVHVSTDYVFDGAKSPHSEDELFAPLSVYGASKAAGDIAASISPKYYIIRTSWVIGDGKNFVRTMLSLAEKGVSPSVVSDQVGRLTFTSTLVSAIDHLLSSNAAFGVYNVSNDGMPVSWADITREIFKIAGVKNTVTNVTTAEYYGGKEGIAPRPLQSTLDLSKIKATGFLPNDWVSELKNYIEKESRK